MLDQVEGVEDGGPRSLSSAKLIEPGQAVRPQHDRLAVNREAFGFDTLGGSGDRRQSRSPVKGVASVQPDRGTVPAHNQPVAVMLDFMDPICTGRRFSSFDRLGRDDEPGRQTWSPE